jgi:hypothetical protein
VRDDDIDRPVAGSIRAHRLAGVQNEVQKYLLKFNAVALFCLWKAPFSKLAKSLDAVHATKDQVMRNSNMIVFH